MHIGPRHHHLTGLQRRAQAIQGLGAEFGKLIQKEHAIVRQRNLAWLGLGAATGQGGHGG
jgi:hypothetical protein